MMNLHALFESAVPAVIELNANAPKDEFGEVRRRWPVGAACYAQAVEGCEGELTDLMADPGESWIGCDYDGGVECEVVCDPVSGLPWEDEGRLAVAKTVSNGPECWVALLWVDAELIRFALDGRPGTDFA